MKNWLVLSLALSAFILSVGFSQASLATVSPLDQQLSLNHLDYSFQAETFSMRRSFNSGRKSIGWFGKGMCSILESKIQIKNNKEYFNFCGAGARLPLDGSYGLKVQKKNGQKIVYGGRYRFIFNKTGDLVNIITSDRKVVQISHSRNQKKIRHEGEELTLFMDSGRVSQITAKNVRIQYKYTRAGALLEVLKNKKPIYNYAWKKGKLISYVSNKGQSKRYDYQGDRVIKITSGSCVETLQTKLVKKSTRLYVKKSCKGQRPEQKEFRISGKDKRFNYKLIEKLSNEVKEKTVKNGFLASKKVKGNQYSYDYDGLGRIKRIQMNQILLTVNERDRFHVKSLNVASKKQPQKTLARLNLKWQDNELASYQFKQNEYVFEKTKYGNRLRSPQYRLSVLRRGKKILIKGIWRGDKISPIRMDRGIASLEFKDREVINEVIRQDVMKRALEAL